MPSASGPAGSPKQSLAMVYASGAAFLQMQKLARVAQDSLLRRLLRKEPETRTVQEIQVLQSWVNSRLSAQTRASAVRADVLPRALRYMSLRKGEPLIAQHEVNGRFYIIMRGSLSFYEVLDEVKLLHVETGGPKHVDTDLVDQDDDSMQKAAESLSIKLERERRARRDAVLAQLIPHHRKELSAKEYQPPDSSSADGPSSGAIRRGTLKSHQSKRAMQQEALSRAAAITVVTAGNARRNPAASEMRVAATRLQTAQRARIARALPLVERIRACQQMDHAAVIVQLAIRGFLARVQRRRRARKEASRRSYAMRLTSTDMSKAYEGRDDYVRAATSLQAGHRGWVVRNEVSRRSRAAVKVQASVRCLFARRFFANACKAAVSLEAAARGHQARNSIMEQHLAATHLQARVRLRGSRRWIELIRAERRREVGNTRFVFVRTGDQPSFGEASLLFGEAHRFSAVADEPTEIAYIDRDEYLAILHADLISQRISFLASLPALKEAAEAFNDSLPALASCLTSSNPKHGDRISLSTSGGKMMLIERGDVSVSFTRRSHQSLLVLGPGSVYGASGEARRLEQAKEITLTAATACTLLWVHPGMIAARLGNACIAKIVDQEVASLNVARSREPVKKIQKLSTIEREERAEREDAHFRTRSMPLSPESAKHRKAFLVTSVSMVRKTGNHRGLRNIFIEPDQMRPEDVEVKRPPLPRSGDPDAPIRPSTSLPALPSPWESPRKARPTSGSSWSRHRTIGAHAAAHPPQTIGTRSLSVATLIRPGSAIVRSSSDFLLIEDHRGRWKALNRRGRKVVA